jgi:hypothetical protein
MEVKVGMNKDLIIDIEPYWAKIVDHYYTQIETGSDGDDIPQRLSIWEWLEQDFNAIRYQVWRKGNGILIFETEAELIFFKLRWA